MQLKKIEVIDFKRIEKVEIDLSDVNILVGTNNSGKSSIIQAVHLACCLIRQADRVRFDTSTVGIDELDYLPTNNYKSLGYKFHWGNKADTPSSQVKLVFCDQQTDYIAECEIRSARNAGISITGTIPNELQSLLRNKRKFYSSYIPGISGIPNKEERKAKKVILKACSYGDSNIILRNVLLLLNEEDSKNIDKIQNWIKEIIGEIKININYNDESDLIIDCKVEKDGIILPIELMGSGYIQLIQIFSYILLFKPGILLVDEPDIHLHPSVQEKLVKVLAKVANQENVKILLTTHSPFILRGALPSTNVYWLEAGKVESKNRNEIEMALGWGAFGKKIIIFSEDTNISFLKKIIAQWPELDKFITYFPGTGYKSIPTPQQAVEIVEALGRKFIILIHRDRDSLSDQEVIDLTKNYEKNKGVFLWFPDDSDIEAYFCLGEFLVNYLQCSSNEAFAYIDSAKSKLDKDITAKFVKQRKAHNSELYPDGGSPTNENVWKLLQSRKLNGANGKIVFAKLKNLIPKNVFNEESVLNHEFQLEIGVSLKDKLRDILGT